MLSILKDITRECQNADKGEQTFLRKAKRSVIIKYILKYDHPHILKNVQTFLVKHTKETELSDEKSNDIKDWVTQINITEYVQDILPPLYYPPKMPTGMESTALNPMFSSPLFGDLYRAYRWQNGILLYPLSVKTSTYNWIAAHLMLPLGEANTPVLVDLDYRSCLPEGMFDWICNKWSGLYHHVQIPTCLHDLLMLFTRNLTRDLHQHAQEAVSMYELCFAMQLLFVYGRS
jgi:hypothetical protein